jgi:hypothetical protein
MASNTPVLVKPNRPVLVKPNSAVLAPNINKAWYDMLKGVKHFESYRAEAYTCCGGKRTIGYGHTGIAVSKGIISEREASDLLEKELQIQRGSSQAGQSPSNRLSISISNKFHIQLRKGRTLSACLSRGAFKRWKLSKRFRDHANVSHGRGQNTQRACKKTQIRAIPVEQCCGTIISH